MMKPRPPRAFWKDASASLRTILKNAQVISETAAVAPNVVVIGRTVVVREQGTEMEEEYTIVGPPEANPAQGRISNESPMGRALLNKRVGEQAVVVSPGGEIVFEIVKVKSSSGDRPKGIDGLYVGNVTSSCPASRCAGHRYAYSQNWSNAREYTDSPSI